MKTILASLSLLAACSSSSSKDTLRTAGGGPSVVEPTPQNQQGGEDGTKEGGKGGATPDPVKDPQSQEPVVSKPIEGLACPSSKVVRGAKFCESTVEGVAVKWVPLEGNVQPTRIAFYLHGDTANDWYNPFIVSSFLSWAQKNKVLLVMPRATSQYDDDGPDEWSYGSASTEDADKLAALVQTFITQYKTPSDNLLYMGISGGPWFLSSSWIPKMGGRFPGLYALSCGGSQFWRKMEWDPKSAALKDRVKIFYNYGEKDFLAKPIEQSHQHYLSLGLPTTKQMHAGAQHCDHDIYGPTIAFWEANLK